MKLLLKRHPPVDPASGQLLQSLTEEQKRSHPAPDQLDVGELAINTITGKIYTKLLDGSIVEFVSQKICFDPAPEVLFFYEGNQISSPNYLIENFCCAGGLFTAVINRLKPSPIEYKFFLTELTSNTSIGNIDIKEPNYETYTETIENNIITYRKATVPILLTIPLETSNQYNNISIFQFKITDINDQLIRGSERTLTLRCLERNS